MTDNQRFESQLRKKELKDSYRNVPSDELRAQLPRMESEEQIEAANAILKERGEL